MNAWIRTPEDQLEQLDADIAALRADLDTYPDSGYLTMLRGQLDQLERDRDRLVGRLEAEAELGEGWWDDRETA